MNTQQIIEHAERIIQKEAYQGRVQEELKNLGFDVHMMEYEMHTSHGKAFGLMQLLMCCTDKSVDEIYEQAIEEATQDIYNTIDLPIDERYIKLLDLAGFDGAGYYKTYTKYNQI